MRKHPHYRANGVAARAGQPGTPRSARAAPVLEFSECSTPVEPAAELDSHSDATLRSLRDSDQALHGVEARGLPRASSHDLPA